MNEKPSVESYWVDYTDYAALRDALDNAESDAAKITAVTLKWAAEKTELQATIARQQRAIERKDAALCEACGWLPTYDMTPGYLGFRKRFDDALAYTGVEP